VRGGDGGVQDAVLAPMPASTPPSRQARKLATFTAYSVRAIFRRAPQSHSMHRSWRHTCQGRSGRNYEETARQECCACAAFARD
jgi:hypothetical protein